MPEPPKLPNAEEDLEGLFPKAVAHWNAREFWEAHEAWEDLWNQALDEHKRWLQGLIQYAAAFFHFERGFFVSGCQRLFDTATEKVTGYEGTTHGMDWADLQAQLAPWIAFGKTLDTEAPFPDAPAPLPVIRMCEG